MKIIKQFLTHCSENYNISEYDGHLEDNTDIIKILFVKPHEGNHNQWLVRISTQVAFDRWANSSAIEKFFDTEKEVVDYISFQQASIYRGLLSYLSREYEELEKDYDDLDFQGIKIKG